MLRRLVDRLIPANKVFVGYRYIRMPGLVFRYDYALSISQVSDAGLLQAVELVTVREAENATQLIDPVSEDTPIRLDRGRAKYLATKKVTSQKKEDTTLNHELKNPIVQRNHAILPVFTYQG